MLGLDPSLKKIWQISKLLAATMGFELLWLEDVAVSGQRTLRLFIDKPDQEGGINVDECADFSRTLERILDVEAD